MFHIQKLAALTLLTAGSLGLSACSKTFDRPEPTKQPENVTQKFLKTAKYNGKFESANGESFVFSGPDGREVEINLVDEQSTNEAQFLCKYEVSAKVGQVLKLNPKSDKDGDLKNYEMGVKVSKLKVDATNIVISPKSDLNIELIKAMVEKQANDVCKSEARKINNVSGRYTFDLADFSGGHIELVRGNKVDSPSQLNQVFVGKRSGGYDVTKRFFTIYGASLSQTEQGDDLAFGEMKAKEKQMLIARSVFNEDGAEHTYGFTLDIDKVFVTPSGLELEISKVSEERAQQNPDAPDVFAADPLVQSLKDVSKQIDQAAREIEQLDVAKKPHASTAIAIVTVKMLPDSSLSLQLSEGDIVFYSPAGSKKEMRNSDKKSSSPQKQPLMF